MLIKSGSLHLGLATLIFPSCVIPTAMSLVIALAWTEAALAQGSPVPGSNYAAPQNTYTQSSGYQQAPVPGQAPGNAYIAPSGGSSYGAAAAPSGVRKAQPAGKSAYLKLPLNIEDAKVRITELRNLLSVSRPQDVQESIFQLAEWLSDMADAHWKLSLALAKNDAMKAAAAQERQSAVKFSSLKHEAGLLKAELFIKQNRLPEALGPLVDIVVAEPKSLIGQAAYEKLKEIGFAEEVADPGYQVVDRAANKSAPAVLTSVPQLKPAVASPVIKPARTAPVTKTR